jgi:hypothetical protein
MASDELLDVLVYLPGTAPRKLAGNALMTVDEMRRQVANDTDLIVITADDDADDSDADLEASPISGEKTLRDLARGPVVEIHCHHCPTIRVTVNYQKHTIHRKFLPSTRARKVLRWSKRKLHLTDIDADNLALFLCEGGEQVRETTHLSELQVGIGCEICFNLAKDHNIEGSA